MLSFSNYQIQQKLPKGITFTLNAKVGSDNTERENMIRRVAPGGKLVDLCSFDRLGIGPRAESLAGFRLISDRHLISFITSPYPKI